VSLILQMLKPSRAEIRALALRETDPKRASEFEQLCLGQIPSILLLLAIGACSVIVSPFRIAARLVGRHRD
jgi:hypothetical protein